MRLFHGAADLKLMQRLVENAQKFHDETMEISPEFVCSHVAWRPHTECLRCKVTASGKTRRFLCFLFQHWRPRFKNEQKREEEEQQEEEELHQQQT